MRTARPGSRDFACGFIYSLKNLPPNVLMRRAWCVSANNRSASEYLYAVIEIGVFFFNAAGVFGLPCAD